MLRTTFHIKLFIFLLLINLLSCTTLSKNNYDKENFLNPIDFIPDDFEWKKMNDYFKLTTVSLKEIPLVYHCAIINLNTPKIKILAYPSDESDYINLEEKIIDGITIKEFSHKFITDISINSSPYETHPKNLSALKWLTSKRKNIGIHIVNKKCFSNPVEKYAALTLNKDADNTFTAHIEKSQSNINLYSTDYAFGGFFSILENYEKKDFILNRDSRTAVGISEDGKTLFILAVEGENKSESIGLSFPECDDILLALGAKDAMQFDGGGSSGFFVSENNIHNFESARKNSSYFGFSFIELEK